MGFPFELVLHKFFLKDFMWIISRDFLQIPLRACFTVDEEKFNLTVWRKLEFLQIKL